MIKFYFKKENFELTLKHWQQKYIIEFSPVDREKINANAIVVFYEKTYFCYYDKNLTPSVLAFVKLHEIGHIALGFLSHTASCYNKKIERTINLFAVRELKKSTSAISYRIILMAFYISEAFGFYVLRNSFKFKEVKCLKNK